MFATFVCFAFSSFAKAEESESSNVAMEKNYVLITTQVNYPIAKSLSFLRSGGYGYGLQYMHTLDRDWVMSVGGKFRNFNEKTTDQRKVMSTLYHETLAKMRIYYPAYFLFGFQMLYILPSVNNSIPPKRDPILDAEVGVGVTAYIFTRLGNDYSAYFKVDRWRGTKTTRLQAYEVSFGIGRSF